MGWNEEEDNRIYKVVIKHRRAVLDMASQSGERAWLARRR